MKRLKYKTAFTVMRRESGFTLLDVLMGVVIFAVGMLALASLQTNLTRASVDANTRTIASNIGEEILERLRSFRLVATDPNGVLFAFADIDDSYVESVLGAATVTRSGLNFTVDADVTAFDFNADRTAVTVTEDVIAGVAHDFKMIELIISWNNNQTFVIDDDTAIAGTNMGTGAMTIKAVIPSIPSLANALVSATDDGKIGGVIVDYQPGARPEIIALDLEGGKFKESTTPRPDVVRTDTLSETWFDVITYNQDNSGTAFLRREEFLVISCECTLMAADPDNPALMPTVWTGQKYSDERWETKPYGTSANNQQSAYCDTCCRDHHDLTGANEDEIYDPVRLDNNRPSWSEDGTADSPAGDHAHYSRSNKGVLTVASVGDTYVEACRMVRKDGFMRVAQDLRQEGFVGFPEGFLDTPSGAADYSDYVVNAVGDLYHGNYTANGVVNNPADRIEPPAADRFPADSAGNATTLPFLGIPSQQMRSRAVYMDHLTQETLTLVYCIRQYEADYAAAVAADPDYDGDTPGDLCGAPGVTSHLQVLPFFDVQTTWLAFWDTNPMGDPVSVTNQAVADNNAHSRGYALLENPVSEPTTPTVGQEIYRGNIGLTVTDPITSSEKLSSNDSDNKNFYTMHVAVNGGGTPTDPNGYVWEADFSSAVNRVEVSDTVVTPLGDEYCTRTSTALRCITPLGASGSVTISGYTKLNGQTFVPLYICDTEPEGQDLFTVSNDALGASNTATLSWSATADNATVSLSIEDEVCTP